MDKLKAIYYSPSGYQRGITAAGKLHAKVPSLTKAEIQHWLDRQPIYQIYKSRPKKVKYPHYTEDKPNKVHQMDILYLPKDDKYKYALTFVDVASRYKAAVPLKTKTAPEVVKAVELVYDNTPLTYPSTIMTDYGREFMGEFITRMKKRNVKITRSLNKKKVAFVERFNQTLAEKLFAHQYAEELKTKGTNREWVKRLPEVVDAINDEETRMIGMKPIDAIKLDSVPQPKYKHIPEELSIDSLVRYLYKPGEEHNDTRFRATDAIWSVNVYAIDKIDSEENQPAVYTLQPIPVDEPNEYNKNLDDRTFTGEQLQVVPPDTEGL